MRVLVTSRGPHSQQHQLSGGFPVRSRKASKEKGDLRGHDICFCVYVCMYSAQHTFLIRKQIVNTFSFMGHTVSVATTQLCLGSMKAAIHDISAHKVAMFQ